VLCASLLTTIDRIVKELAQTTPSADSNISAWETPAPAADFATELRRLHQPGIAATGETFEAF
jgi:hypothetical protein